MPLKQLHLRSERRRAATESHSRPRHSADPLLRPLSIIIRVLNNNATHTVVTIGLSDANAKDNDFSVDTEIAAHRVGPLRSAPTLFLIVNEDCKSYGMEKSILCEETKAKKSSLIKGTLKKEEEYCTRRLNRVGAGRCGLQS